MLHGIDGSGELRFVFRMFQIVKHFLRSADLLCDTDYLINQPVFLMLDDPPIVRERCNTQSLVLGSTAFEVVFSLRSKQLD